jgi:hypothetical protein
MIAKSKKPEGFFFSFRYDDLSDREGQEWELRRGSIRPGEGDIPLPHLSIAGVPLPGGLGESRHSKNPSGSVEDLMVFSCFRIDDLQYSQAPFLTERGIFRAPIALYEGLNRTNPLKNGRNDRINS